MAGASKLSLVLPHPEVLDLKPPSGTAWHLPPSLAISSQHSAFVSFSEVQEQQCLQNTVFDSAKHSH
ncbi:hypothetical protein E2C01_006398 [Portunus trituberculatus]|uniref:Uncharacterized protein n=1 Tax=Portunus trituberculatus TaxID=210409 RepID=A0A5B7CZ83_PORTR|nr:hypothetical protein [Portunus trituberculatus]